MLKNKSYWISLVLSLICLAIAYWQASDMAQLAANKQVWQHQPLWFMLSAWAALLLITWPWVSKLEQKVKLLLASVSTGILFWSGFMPNHFLIGPFIAFVPLLWAENEVLKANLKTRSALWLVFKLSFIAFFTWNILSTSWVINTGFVAGLLANFLNALLMTIPFVLFHLVHRRHNDKTGLWALASFWLSFEFIHFYWDISWPWLSLGHAFAHYPSLIQWYEYTGVSGGSLWIIAINLAFWSAIQKAQIFKEKNHTPFLKSVLFFSWRPILWFTAPSIMSLVWYNNYTEKAIGTTNVMVVQPNFEPHYQKYSVAEHIQFERFVELTEKNISEKTNYIVYPETSFDGIRISQIRADQDLYALRTMMQKYPNAALVTGVSMYERYNSRADAPANPTVKRTPSGGEILYSSYNSAIQIEGNNDHMPIYHKSKLVPGSESMPYIGNIALFQGLIMDLGGAYGGGLATQENRTIFETDNARIAPIICYESVYGPFVTDYIKLGAEILFVMTNDGWWGKTYGHKQHLYLSSIRAIENRRWVARSANTGISGFINSRGDIVAATNYEETATLSMDVPRIQAKTFFTTWGDVIGRYSLLLSALLLFSGIVRGFSPDKFKVGKFKKDNNL